LSENQHFPSLKGAVAGFAVTDDAREYALKEGFYLIEPNGDNFHITPPNDKPREW